MTTPATPYPGDSQAEEPVGDTSVSTLIGELASDVSTLIRQEVALAKAELKVEAAKAGKGAGLLGGAGVAGLLLLIFASTTLMFVLDLAMPLWVAALIVTIIWGIVAAVLAQSGRTQLKNVNPTPTQTVDSIKETLS